tara:strand:+ start:1498 stop:1863 length:366 start_codon:yes stop_codon:yes gene_type:complete
MMDDDAWKSYTDEKIEQLERELEFKRRIRFLRAQGFPFKRIAELVNELGFSINQSRVYTMTRDIELQPGHGNGGRRWSDEARRRHDEARAEELQRIYGGTEWYRRHYGDTECYRRHYGDKP